MLRALIFDVDGTLAETEELHRLAFNDCFAEAGLGWHWSRTDYHRLLKTTGGKERIARYVTEIRKDPESFDIAALHAEKTRLYTRLMAKGGLSLRQGIADLIKDARLNGLTVAIATTTSRPNVEALALACFGRPAEAVFDVLACGDEVAAKKPAPDVYALALERMGLSAKDCVALEDSRNGLNSSRAAGIACIVSPSAYTAEEDFSGALRVVPEFSELGGIAGIQGLMKEGCNV